MREKLAAHFLSRTRAEWCALLENTDACCSPVLTMQEASSHVHMASRATLMKQGSEVIPAPAPRFSRTPSVMQPMLEVVVSDHEEIAKEWAASLP
jgi:alpha-methylacyl-CoA racemase